MLIPDLDLARRFLDANPPPGRPILCGITGAHHYGFPSPDSDIDLKGIHLAPSVGLLGLSVPQQTHDRLLDFESVECDLTTHEAAKALSLLLAGNGNMLERILSPIQLIEGAEVDELRRHARNAISQCFAGHYRGYFKGMCREHATRAEPRAKSLLYSYRVALTGTHLLRTGELQADINQLAPRYGYPDVAELVAFKQEQGEKSPLPDDLDRHFRGRWEQLGAGLTQALEESPLPKQAANRAELEQWLVALRLKDLEATRTG